MTGLNILFMSLQPYLLKNQAFRLLSFSLNLLSHKSLIIALRFIFASVRFNPSRPFWIWSPISSSLIAVDLFSFYSVNKAEKDLWALHKWWSFPLRIFLVNVTKSAANCGFGHMHQRNPYWKTSFFVQWSYHLGRQVLVLKTTKISFTYHFNHGDSNWIPSLHVGYWIWLSFLLARHCRMDCRIMTRVVNLFIS